MLVERDEMGRAVEARSAVNRQGQDIVDLRGLASEIERVLSENKGAGAYAQSYSELLRFHDGSIRASLDLLALEMELLKGAGVAPSSTMKPRIDGLAAELDKLPGGDKLLEKKGAMSFFPQVLEASAVSTAAYGGSTLDIPAARAALEHGSPSRRPPCTSSCAGCAPPPPTPSWSTPSTVSTASGRASTRRWRGCPRSRRNSRRRRRPPLPRWG